MRRLRTFSAAGLLCGSFLLSGCALLNPFHPVETVVPEKWQQQTQTPPAEGEAPAAWPDAEWWKGFNSAKLDELMTQARIANYDIKAAIARVHQADAQAKIAGSSLLPVIGANADATRTRSSNSRARSLVGTTTSTGTATVTGTSGTGTTIVNDYRATGNASYELDFWGKNIAGLQSAEALADASRFDKETVALTVTSDVATTYFTILGLQDRIAVAKENLAAAEGLLGAIKLRFDNGLANALDMSQQENVVATQRTVLPSLQLQLIQNTNALAILLGKMPESFEGAANADAGLATIALPLVTPGLPSELLVRRPDVRFAEAQLEAAHADINRARAAFFPSITLTGDYGFASTALSELFKSGSKLWSFGATGALPIFDLSLFGQLDYNKARYDELLQNYQKSVISAFSDVENALAAVEQNAAEERAQQESARTALEAYGYAQRQFTGGIIDITTVLNTQRALFSAQDALVSAKLAHLNAMVGLYKVLGGGWDVEKVSL